MDGSAGPRSRQAEYRSAAAEQVAMRMTRPQKITVNEMREISIRGRLVYCSHLQLFTILPPQLKTRWLQFGHGISGPNQLGSI
jgi:hypothetical protein